MMSDVALLARFSWIHCKPGGIAVTCFILRMTVVSVNFYINKNFFFCWCRALSFVNVFFPVVSLQISKQNPSRWSWEVVMYLWYVCRIALFLEILCLLIVGCVSVLSLPDRSIVRLALLSYFNRKYVLQVKAWVPGCFQLFLQMKFCSN